jgi:uncharacterized protein YbjQ (UPF0145 family)
MILTTTESIPGRSITEVIGLVRGSAVRGTHIAGDLIARFKRVVGGEIEEYTKLMAEVREQALDRMVAEAYARGADAVVGLRYASSEIADNAAEILVYGTAVKLEKG